MNQIFVLKRFLAFVIDLACWFVFCLPAWLLVFSDALGNHIVSWHGGLLGILTLLYLLPEATTGWTIGKWSMNLRIMTINAHAWIWPRCLARAFFKYSPMIFLLGLNLLMDVDQDFEAKPILAILILVYIVLYAIVSFPRVSTSRAQRGLYDFIAGTIVVPRSDVTQPRGFEVIQRKNPDIDSGT